MTRVRGAIDLGNEFVVGRWVIEDVNDEGLKSCSGGIRACEENEQDLGFDIRY